MTRPSAFYYNFVRVASGVPTRIQNAVFDQLDAEEFWFAEDEAEFDKVKAERLAYIDRWISDLQDVRKIVDFCKYEHRCYQDEEIIR